MTTGATLLALKKEAEAAEFAADNRDGFRAGRFLIMWTGGFIATCLGSAFAAFGTLTVMGLNKDSLVTSETGLIGVIGGIVFLALAAFLFRLPFIIKAKDKVLAELRDEEASTSATYLKALKSELAAHGIDTADMSERDIFIDEDYEFTARFNGVLSVIAVREVGDEIVVIVNGEQIKKPVVA